MITPEHTAHPTPVLGEEAIQTFAASMRGDLIRRSDDGYDEARSVFNRMIDKRPALIARCAGVADVIAAINFARQHHLLVAVRGGGHSVSGYSVCDDGLVIDLTRMKGIRIDPQERTARAEPGVTWGELNHDLQAFELGATGGYVSITGIGGLTLGGGYGWLVRKHGLALDNLLSVDLVTAEGELITASPTQHPTLYWAVRGGGGNFGVVTSFEYQVHPVGSVLAGLVVHPRSDAMHLLRFYREQIDTLPDELTTAVLLFHLPAAPFLPPTMHGLPVAAMAICYAGDLETGEEVLRPLREFGTPLVDLVERVPYSVTQSMADGLWPPGLHYYWKSSFLRALPDDAMDTFVERASRAPSARTVVLLEHCTSNAIRAVGQQETAFPHRDWPMNLLIATGWERAEDTQENIDWTREFASAMQPHTENALYSNYNFLADAGDEGVRDAYGTSQPHLTEIKSTYDPTNLFRLNPNIRPV